MAVSGKVATFRGRRQMANPALDVVEGEWTGRVVPIYPQSEKAGISSMEIAACVAEALDWAGGLEDPVPVRPLKEHNFAGRDWSMRQAHQPESVGAKGVARRRLGFDELLRLQLVLVMRKRAVERDCVGIAHKVGSDLVGRFHDGLPFPLTKAQERAIAEIAPTSPNLSRCTGCCRATSGLARPWWRCGASSPLSPAGTRGH